MGSKTLMAYYQALKQDDEPRVLSMPYKAVSKGRPRVGKGGHVYTPKQTRDFEKSVADVAATLRRTPYTCPIAVKVAVHDPIPKSYTKDKRLAAELGLISPPVGDLDNKVKAITDALNGILYLDDRQINDLVATRSYGDGHFIFVEVARNGLSTEELARYVRDKHSRSGA